jgi:flavorubredoxin
MLYRLLYRLLYRQTADLQYNTLANGHGPIIRYNMEELVDNYKKWSLAVEKGQVQVGGL